MNYKHDRLTVSGTGIMQKIGTKKNNRTLVDPGDGKHLWIVSSTYLVTNPAKAFTAESIELDIENLMTVVGPGCYKCEELYDPEKTLPHCTGSME